MKKKQLSTKQLDRLSEIFGNIAVAWFSAGIISPLFVSPQSPFALIINIVVSLSLAGFFAFSSIYLIRRRKRK